MWGSNQTFKPKKNNIRGPRPKPKIESNLSEWSHIWERREDTKTNHKNKYAKNFLRNNFNFEIWWKRQILEKKLI